MRAHYRRYRGAAYEMGHTRSAIAKAAILRPQLAILPWNTLSVRAPEPARWHRARGIRDRPSSVVILTVCLPQPLAVCRRPRSGLDSRQRALGHPPHGAEGPKHAGRSEAAAGAVLAVS